MAMRMKIDEDSDGDDDDDGNCYLNYDGPAAHDHDDSDRHGKTDTQLHAMHGS